MKGLVLYPVSKVKWRFEGHFQVEPSPHGPLPTIFLDSGQRLPNGEVALDGSATILDPRAVVIDTKAKTMIYDPRDLSLPQESWVVEWLAENLWWPPQQWSHVRN